MHIWDGMEWKVGFCSVVVAGIVATGCDAMDDGRADPDDATARQAVAFNPPGWGCRTCTYSNSPVLGDEEIGVFSQGAAWAGYTLAGAIEPNTGLLHDVAVVGQALEVYHANGDVLRGNALVGYKLLFKQGKNAFEATIYAYEAHEDWAAGHSIDTYGIFHEVPPGGVGDLPPTNLCPGMNLDETSIVFIEGERYDAQTKTVMPNEPNFVTAACRGHAIAKMKLMGYDPNDAYGSTPPQRQATLKMLTADYCGTGQSFTTIGQPLDWSDAMGNFPGGWGPGYLQDIEARWDDEGALCLAEPRNSAYDHRAVETECGFDIPECEGDPTDLEGAEWASYLVP